MAQDRLAEMESYLDDPPKGPLCFTDYAKVCGFLIWARGEIKRLRAEVERERVSATP